MRGALRWMAALAGLALAGGTGVLGVRLAAEYEPCGEDDFLCFGPALLALGLFLLSCALAEAVGALAVARGRRGAVAGAAVLFVLGVTTAGFAAWFLAGGEDEGAEAYAFLAIGLAAAGLAMACLARRNMAAVTAA